MYSLPGGLLRGLRELLRVECFANVSDAGQGIDEDVLGRGMLVEVVEDVRDQVVSGRPELPTHGHLAVIGLVPQVAIDLPPEVHPVSVGAGVRVVNLIGQGRRRDRLLAEGGRRARMDRQVAHAAAHTHQMPCRPGTWRTGWPSPQPEYGTIFAAALFAALSMVPPAQTRDIRRELLEQIAGELRFFRRRGRPAALGIVRMRDPNQRYLEFHEVIAEFELAGIVIGATPTGHPRAIGRIEPPIGLDVLLPFSAKIHGHVQMFELLAQDAE